MTRPQAIKGLALVGLGLALVAGCTRHTSNPNYYGTSSYPAYPAQPNPVYPETPGTANNPTGLNSPGPTNPTYTPPPSTTYPPPPPSGTVVNPDGSVTTVPQR